LPIFGGSKRTAGLLRPGFQRARPPRGWGRPPRRPATRGARRPAPAPGAGGILPAASRDALRTPWGSLLTAGPPCERGPVFRGELPRERAARLLSICGGAGSLRVRVPVRSEYPYTGE